MASTVGNRRGKTQLNIGKVNQWGMGNGGGGDPLGGEGLRGHAAAAYAGERLLFFFWLKMG